MIDRYIAIIEVNDKQYPGAKSILSKFNEILKNDEFIKIRRVCESELYHKEYVNSCENNKYLI